MAVEAGLLAAEYGCRPSEVLEATHLPPMQRYRLDADVYAAQKAFEAAAKERAREDAQAGDGATPRQQRQLVADQQARADQRDKMAQAGMRAPSREGQADQLAAIREQRAQAGEVTDG